MSRSVLSMCQKAKSASLQVAGLTSKTKNKLLLQMAKEIEKNKELIIQANQKDLNKAAKAGLTPPLLDRLELTPKRIKEMVSGLKVLAKLPDPVGKIAAEWKTKNGLKVKKVRIPLGVIGIIYESRPNVTVDTAALCLKSGNASILRGGSEAFYSNTILGKILRSVLQKNKLNPDIIQTFSTTEHSAVKLLLEQDKFLDLVIPRGGASLMKMVSEHAKVPVLRHDKGVCHLFVDRDADLKMAQKIALNAKMNRPSTCNALETLLVDQKISKKFLSEMIPLFQKSGTEVRGDSAAQNIVKKIKRAKKLDWSTEYLEPIISIKIVKNLDGAIDHIQKYGSYHTESIVTKNKKKAARFLKEVLASVVMVNASTRFNDGFQLGLGAEVGISTTKLHAFGPMGLEELTTTKFVVEGTGQIRT